MRPSMVSTHSRPKAAAFSATFDRSFCTFQHTAARRRLLMGIWCITGCVGFNTQPPEGGWFFNFYCSVNLFSFQHTAARRRLYQYVHQQLYAQRFNTQPPEGGCQINCQIKNNVLVSTHSRPKAAATTTSIATTTSRFNTQPPEGGCPFPGLILL